MSPKETAYIVERLAVRFMSMVADYERKLVEHRDAFGARTSADAKIIEGLRAAADEQVLSASKVAYVLRCAGETPVQAAQRVIKERDGLLTQVQDQRAEIERLKLACDTYAADWDTAGKACRIRVDEDPLSSVIRLVRDDAERAAVAKRLVKERDALRAEVADLRGTFDMVHASLGIKRGDHIGNAIAALKAHTLKRSHPVAVGGYLRRLTGFGTTPAGEVAQVLHVDCDGPATEYTIKRPNGQPGVWSENGCEPCDPPADHDTPAGKEAAEAVIRNSQMTEIKVGDVVEVVSASGGQTWMADVGSTGKVRRFELIDSIECVRLQNLPGKRNALGGYVSLCDVRKVPQ